MAHMTHETNTPAREWLFKADGQVFGPIPEASLIELLLEGKLGAATEIASGDGAWRTAASVPGFLVHLRKAEARARVEAEATSSRKLARRRSALHGTALVLGVVLLLGGATAGAWFLATRRPWERRSKLLEDFGNGIAIEAVRVGGGPRAAQASIDEIAVPDAAGDASPTGKPKRGGVGQWARSQAHGAPRDSLVLAKYDPVRIRAAVARHQGSLAPCLRDEARRTPEFAGEIPIEFAVGNEGRVVALWIDEPRFKSGPLRDCLLEKLRTWSFDWFPGERPIVSLSVRVSAR